MAVQSCGSPADPVVPDPYPVASAVVDSLASAYVGMDLASYVACFRDDFEFHRLQYEWDGLRSGASTDTTSWGLELETALHEAMFDSVIGIELTLEGDDETPWSGDSTGASLLLTREFDLKVYTGDEQTTGYHATGMALFICRRDSEGSWYVWQWYDQSDTCFGGSVLPRGGPRERATWGAIKLLWTESRA